MIKMIQKNMNKKGFTLVELIIVIAVMAILAAIVVPRMTGITASFRRNADERVCENFARELEIMYQLGDIVAEDDDAEANDTSGLVNLVIANVEDPASDADDEADLDYYFTYDDTNDTIFVYVATEELAVADIADVVHASRTNAIQINN